MTAFFFWIFELTKSIIKWAIKWITVKEETSLCDECVTKQQQVNSNDRVSLVRQRSIFTQQAEVVVPPGDVYHLQSSRRGHD